MKKGYGTVWLVAMIAVQISLDNPYIKVTIGLSAWLSHEESQ